LVRNIVDHESVVQKNRVKTLQRHRLFYFLLLVSIITRDLKNYYYY